MRWPLTFISESFVPEGSAACARGPVIFIRPSFSGDDGLYRHEIEHVKQWFVSLGAHPILYALSKRYRLWAEVKAYRVQLKSSPGKENLFAGFIATKYRLDISKEVAKSLLTDDLP